ncbi:MAG: 4-hydroxythreonine-4-phosphate dehydrogenase PdxA, partial [Candidatus Hydrogenedentes bacterium]|nr:4-hydroxythreonine-4-phosphate dehydrogenase PdxA [Candidatus Hydrogenedentota bacterium]
MILESERALRPRLAITMGDVNGIGPEILAKALSRDAVFSVCDPFVVGSASILAAQGPMLANLPQLREVRDPAGWRHEPGTLSVFSAGVADPPHTPGVLDGVAGAAAVAWIRAAVQLALDGVVDGIVTCPINKEGIKLGGCPSTGHTEIIAEMTASPDYRMCLFTDQMRIVHISAHFPLREAVEMVRADRIETSIRIAQDALIRIGLPRKRIAVAGLNPHAGEAGLLGDEELREIEPAIARCQSEGIDCSGPYPPDTVFRRMADGEFDLVVAMYHDQGHIPLKLIAMDEGV